MAVSISRLRELINITHQHGVKLQNEINDLKTHKPAGWRAEVAWKHARLMGLKALNFKRRVELAQKEHKPVPKPPPPKPKPQPRHQVHMYDAVEISAIPVSSPEAVAGYISGAYQNYWALKRRFPHAKILSIATNAGVDADVLDIETGDAVPSQAPGWVRKQHARGVKWPILYMPESIMWEVIRACENSGIHRSEFRVWSAHWVDRWYIDPGADATQCFGERGRPPYDASLCEPYFFD